MDKCVIKSFISGMAVLKSAMVSVAYGRIYSVLLSFILMILSTQTLNLCLQPLVWFVFLRKFGRVPAQKSRRELKGKNLDLIDNLSEYSSIDDETEEEIEEVCSFMEKSVLLFCLGHLVQDSIIYRQQGCQYA